MSTKMSLSYGEKHHLYEECCEKDKAVYLEMRNCEFECHNDGQNSTIMVRIPLYIWDVIRKKTCTKDEESP